MEQHKIYLLQMCRLCFEVKDEKKYKILPIHDIFEDAYIDEELRILSNDKEETDSQVLCKKCYNTLQNWKKALEKYRLHKRKNPGSEIDFGHFYGVL